MDKATRSTLYFAIIGLLIATAVIGVLQTAPLTLIAKEGTVSVYFSGITSDIQIDTTMAPTAPGTASSNADILSLNVTIDSVSVHRNGAANASGWTVISHTSMTMDLLKPANVTTLIAMGQVPEQNITMVKLHVANAVVSVRDSEGTVSSKPVVVSSNELKIPIGSVRVASQSNTSITAERPHIVVQGNGTIRLTPVLHVDKIEEPE